MSRVIPLEENRRLIERRSGFMQVKRNQVIQEPSNCFICNNYNNIKLCRICYKSSCDDCRNKDMCILCDDSEEPTMYQRCFYRCFKIR